MPAVDVTVTEGGDAVFWVFVQPGAVRAQVTGPYIDCLRLRVTAAPERGRANDEVEALLARTLEVARRDVRIELGAASRRKRVRIVGGASPAVMGRLVALLGGAG